MKARNIPWKAMMYILVIIGLFAGGIYFVLPGFLKMNALLREESQMDKYLTERENKKSQMEGYLHKLQDDPVYVEKVARDEMGLSKDNEIIYKFDK